MGLARTLWVLLRHFITHGQCASSIPLPYTHHSRPRWVRQWQKTLEIPAEIEPAQTIRKRYCSDKASLSQSNILQNHLVWRPTEVRGIRKRKILPKKKKCHRFSAYPSAIQQSLYSRALQPHNIHCSRDFRRREALRFEVTTEREILCNLRNEVRTEEGQIIIHDIEFQYHYNVKWFETIMERDDTFSVSRSSYFKSASFTRTRENPDAIKYSYSCPNFFT